MKQNKRPDAPVDSLTTGNRIYHMHPLMAGPIRDEGGHDWYHHLDRVVDMGFNWLAIAPFHTVVGGLSLHSVADPMLLHPEVRGRARGKGYTALRDFVAAASERGVGVMMELLITDTPDGSAIATDHPEWIQQGEGTPVGRPFDYDTPAIRDEVVRYWKQVVRHYLKLGIRGFLCNSAHKAPPLVWSEIISAIHHYRGSFVVAETLGARQVVIEPLQVAGFDAILDSSRWWDFHSPWITQEHDHLRSVAPTVAFPAGFGSESLESELGLSDESELGYHYLFRYEFAALSSPNVIVPMGYEFVAAVDLGKADSGTRHWQAIAKQGGDIIEPIRQINSTCAGCRATAQEGSKHLLALPAQHGSALLRQVGEEGVLLLLINANPDNQVAINLARLWESLTTTIETYQEIATGGEGREIVSETIALSPLSIRLFHGDYLHTRDHRAEISQLAPNREVVDAILGADYGDPFAVRGMHLDTNSGHLLVRTFQPGAERCQVVELESGQVVGDLARIHDDGFFTGPIPAKVRPFAYRLRITRGGQCVDVDDPYRFDTLLGDFDLHLLKEGSHHLSYEQLGAHPRELQGVSGVTFALWAPGARTVAVVGDFNHWDGRCHPMRMRDETGIWEIFIPAIGEGERYKFEIKGGGGELLPQKSDPFGFASERSPGTASIVHSINRTQWDDESWLAQRSERNSLNAPISIYEVHLGSWRRVAEEGNRYLSYRELADQLVPYVKYMGFTHIEMLPVSEFPFDGSWGYQPIGLFAPSSRFGTPDDFKYLIERCHQEGIGVLIDWVPGHFPTDPHGLGHFDGSHLYEHADPRQGFHQDWNTLIYNFGRKEVANFLLSNALYWFDRYHIDGLRVDAVASMLYLDYSRKEGEWVPNRHGGNENLEAIDFLRQMNELVYGYNSSVMTCAEESTSWPGVSRPVYTGGLGFGFKWNMGWMNDTLRYMEHDPIHRCYHHNQMTFGLLYAFSENFILPLSHDEVVHGKRSLLGRMPGDTWQQFANLRTYYGFMWGHPGKKLLFMGGEFAQGREWDHDSSLDWHLLDIHWHSGVQRWVRDLNHLYTSHPALHQMDCDAGGFEWIKANSAEESVYAFIRRGNGGSLMVVICNFTPVARSGYRVGVPSSGYYRECLNSDAEIYGGGNIGNSGGVHASEVSYDDKPWSLAIELPPLATLFLSHEGGASLS